MIGEAARAAELPFLLYSSVGGAERHSGVPHFESKRQIEKFLTGLVPLNLVRPSADFDRIRELVPDLEDLATWLQRQSLA